MKRIAKGLFWLLIIALLMAPLWLIFRISDAEMQEYATPTAPLLQETAIGAVVQAKRQDISEYVTVAGDFTSSAYAYMELDHKTAGNTRWTVGMGDEIQEGQTIGTYKGNAVTATLSGIIVEMNTYSTDAYIRVQLLEPVELRCRVEDRVLSMLRRSETLTTARGEAVTLAYASRQKNPDGTTDIRLSIDTDRYTYGQQVERLEILTGRVYSRTVVLPVDCVYQKETGEDKPWYARLVTESGLFLAELEVQIGYSNSDMVCVSGVSEGDWFDSGYKAIMGG